MTRREGRAAAAARLREYVENLEPFADATPRLLSPSCTAGSR